MATFTSRIIPQGNQQNQGQRGGVSIIVDGKEIEVPQDTTPEQILESAGKSAHDYNLEVDKPSGGTDVVPGGQRIKTPDGGVFSSALKNTGG